MATRDYRLTGVGAFESLFRAGRRREGRYVQLVHAAAARDPGRVGFVVGRKVLPRAVDRNRFKRLVRDMLRRDRSGLLHLDLIVRLKRPLSRAEIEAAAAEAGELLARCARETAP